jgi:hypothetical protein
MKNILVAASLAAVALIAFFWFPGHTWIQQDTQIYAAILEHLRDPAALQNDILVQRPHVAFTIYDELAIWLRSATGWGFGDILGALQFASRLLGLCGLYLAATAMGLTAGQAVLSASILALGSVVGGPTVLTWEYEPDPRGFAIPLVFLAIGLLAHKRHALAGVAAGTGFLLHPPSIYPFLAVYFCLALWPAAPPVMRGRLWGLVPLLAATVLLLIASRHQAGIGEAQIFFNRLAPEQEKLQRLRASYVWVSTWARTWLPQYLVLLAVAWGAYWRLRDKTPTDLRAFLVGLPALGLLSVPVSWLLLERMKWALIPQFQPARALLFVVVIAVFSAAAAGMRAAARGRWPEAFLWLIPAFLLPANNGKLLDWPGWERAALVAALAALAVSAGWAEGQKRRWAPVAVSVAVLAAFLCLPTVGRVVNYPRLHTPELAQLSEWARTSTARDAVFLFADARYGGDAGIFRIHALRAIYVDWKGGGQVNYLRTLGEQWWQRWQAVNMCNFRIWNLSRYAPLGIDYLVLGKTNRLRDRQPVFENGKYLVYRLRAAT